MYNWSVDEERFKREDPEGYAIWARNERAVQKAVNFFSKNKWVIGGRIYVRKQKAGFDVSFSFELDEAIAPTISVIDQDKTMEDLPRLHLVGRF